MTLFLSSRSPRRSPERDVQSGGRKSDSGSSRSERQRNSINFSFRLVACDGVKVESSQVAEVGTVCAREATQTE